MRWNIKRGIFRPVPIDLSIYSLRLSTLQDASGRAMVQIITKGFVYLQRGGGGGLRTMEPTQGTKTNIPGVLCVCIEPMTVVGGLSCMAPVLEPR